jgi:hypothetical protein
MVHLGGLLGEQGGLPLWSHDDGGHEFELGERCQEPVEDEGLVERRVHVVRPVPASVQGWIGPQDMVVDLDVPVAKLLNSTYIRTNRPRVGRELGLAIDNAYLHRVMGALLRH